MTRVAGPVPTLTPDGRPRRRRSRSDGSSTASRSTGIRTTARSRPAGIVTRTAARPRSRAVAEPPARRTVTWVARPAGLLSVTATRAASPSETFGVSVSETPPAAWGSRAPVIVQRHEAEATAPRPGRRPGGLRRPRPASSRRRRAGARCWSRAVAARQGSRPRWFGRAALPVTGVDVPQHRSVAVPRMARSTFRWFLRTAVVPAGMGWTCARCSARSVAVMVPRIWRWTGWSSGRGGSCGWRSGNRARSTLRASAGAAVTRSTDHEEGRRNTAAGAGSEAAKGSPHGRPVVERERDGAGPAAPYPRRASCRRIGRCGPQAGSGGEHRHGHDRATCAQAPYQPPQRRSSDPRFPRATE